MEQLLELIRRFKGATGYAREGLLFSQADSSESGIQLAKEILCKICDEKTVLFLSGGKTPQELYKQLAEEGNILAASVALIDERYGASRHRNSNEKLIQDTQLLKYFQYKGIPFLPILAGDLSREETAEKYDEKVRTLLFNIPKSIGILGIGVDGHTAGLPAGVHSSQFTVHSERMVVEIGDFPGEFKERITLTFQALSLFDVLIVIAFGEEKKEVLRKMFEKGPIEEIPARFYLRENIAKKTILITDQEI